MSQLWIASNNEKKLAELERLLGPLGYRLRRLAERSGLDPDFAEKFLEFVIKEVIRHHEQARS